MLRHPDYTRARLARLAERIRATIYPEVCDVEHLEVSPAVDRIRWAQARELPYRPARIGEQFGPLWATYWFRARHTVPEAWRGARVDLLWVSHSEATLWVDGRVAQGLNHEPVGPDGATRPDAVLLAEARGGEALEFAVEMACNRLFGEPRSLRARPYRSLSPFVLDQCALARFDPRAWELFHDFAVLQQLEADGDDLDPTFRGELLAELNRFANAYDPEAPASWDAAHKILRALYARRNATRVHELSAAGHAHIDTAWLWPIAETYRKCERTFSSQLAYMARYPEFRFACSQAQQYAWVRERNPELYARIRAAVAAGQFLPVGGTWVEPDCNLPSGEALARQFLYGQRFFRAEFGVTCREFWQPDVFGYNGQLPQLMRQAAITRFVTQKLSWNRFNRPQHHTFTWQGIDGSEVLAHFPPADTYSADADVRSLRRSARDYKDHDRSRHSLLLFGHGDGGGGPTPRMLEYLRRARDLQGLPRTAQRSPEEFFALLEADCTDRPTVVGELYFEYHRGTYTSQAQTKRANRRCEFLLHDAEFLAACAARLGAGAYPGAELERLWKLLLTNQFHDILPGSSIAEVYADAARDYAEIEASGGRLRDAALAAVAAALTGGGDAGSGGPLPVNTLGCARDEVAALPDGALCRVAAPPYGPGAVLPARDAAAVRRAPDGALVLENAHLRATLTPGGALASLVHKASGREALAAPGNVLELYDDEPTDFDAWDIDPFHLETGRPCPAADACAVVAEGPLRAAVAFERRLGARSTLRQTVRLDADARRLEFHTEVDWQESHKLLKAAFPVSVRALNATYEMPFGHVERPTHYSTSFDLARFEVPGHRWSDLSEHGFGVALLTESKYGYSTYGDTLRVSLLRAPEHPAPGADRGRHRFAYAVMPHAGNWREAGVVAEALRFNAPLLWTRGAAAPRSLLEVADPNLLLDTVKRAEDSDALLLRLYEAHGARGVARLRCALPFARATFCNVLEERGEPAALEDGAVLVPYRPHQIVSLLLE